MKLTQLFESISHENILQNIATAIINELSAKTIDRVLNCGRLKDFIPTKTLGSLYGRLANIELTVVDRPHSNNGEFFANTITVYRNFGWDKTFNATVLHNFQSDLVHELRHALDFSLRKRKRFSRKQSKGTEPVEKFGNVYLKQPHEINARVSEVANAISTELTRRQYKETPITDDQLTNLVLKLCDRYQLSHIFKTTNPFAKDEELHIYGRSMERSHPMFSPMDNKQFRRIFNRLFAFAKTKLSTPV